jgi:hypothetical protein
MTARCKEANESGATISVAPLHTPVATKKTDASSDFLHVAVEEGLAHYKDCPYTREYQVCLCDFSDYLPNQT